MEARAHLRLLASLVVATFVLAASGRASASEGAMRLKVDWDALGGSLADLRGSIVEGARARLVTSDQSKWLEAKPVLVSVVARNWEGASRLVGGPMPATDAIRVSRSSRMLVGRVGWTSAGWIVPFVHVGVGQWRDPDPHALAAPLEYAAQIGAGVEVASIRRACVFAVEYDWTRAYGEDRDVEARAARMLGWGEAFAVARFEIDRAAH